MAVRKKIIRKKKINETSEALTKITGGNELEVASVILQELAEKFPGFVTNPRGIGLFAAFDLPSSTERDHAWCKMMENDLLILTSGDQAIRFRPHLNVSTEDIDTAINIISKSLKDSLR